jgi:hypothetical protein
LKYSEKEIVAGEGNGYLFSDGRCEKIKLPDWSGISDKD